LSLPAAQAIINVVFPSSSLVAGATPALAKPHRTVGSFWLRMAPKSWAFLSPPPPWRPIFIAYGCGYGLQARALHEAIAAALRAALGARLLQ
jgi:hypothetical protein